MDHEPTGKFLHLEIYLLMFFSADLKGMLKGEKALLEGLQPVFSGPHQIIVSESGSKDASGKGYAFRSRLYCYHYLAGREDKPA